MKTLRHRSSALAGALSVTLSLVVASHAGAQTPATLTTWDLTGEPGNQVATLATGDAPHVQGLPLTRGAGVTPSAGIHSISASGWHDLGAEDYFSFGFSVEPGYRVDLAELHVATRASSTGPANIELRSSHDGFSTRVVSLTNSAASATNFVLDLSALAGLTGTLELRLSAVDALSAGGGTVGNQGSFRITRLTSGASTLPVALLGTVSAGGIGDPYCAEAVVNSSGRVGFVSAAGSRVRSHDDVTLWATDLPQQTFGYFLASRQRGLVLQPGGSAGVLCLGSPIGRYVGPGQIRNSGAAGSFSLALDLGRMPLPVGTTSAAAGETWHFQAWFRDNVSGAATSNFTNGHSVTFL